MTQKSLSFHDLDISFDTVYRQMGYLDARPSNDVMAKTEDVSLRMSEVAHPQFCFVTSYATLHEHMLVIDDKTLHIGRMIARQLAGSEAFALFVATAGHEWDFFRKRLADEGDTLGSFIADALGNVVVERCADLMEKILQQSIDKLGWQHTNRFSPGYCHWDVCEQKSLFHLLGGTPCGVTLNAQCMMSPTKSVSGIIGMGRHVQHLDYACGMCDMSHCQFRKN